MSFDEIAESYAQIGGSQQHAAKILLRHIKSDRFSSILDLGCGPGHITKLLRFDNKAKITAIDPSNEMINQAKLKYNNSGINFRAQRAEDLDELEVYDLIFCNSAFHWFTNIDSTLLNCHRALKNNGVFALQAPSDLAFPFNQSVEKMKKIPSMKAIFDSFSSPVIFLHFAEAYRNVFEKAGFTIKYCKIHNLSETYTLEQAIDVFNSGPAQLFLNQEYYKVPLSQKFKSQFIEELKSELTSTLVDNILTLISPRIFLVAEKQTK